MTHATARHATLAEINITPLIDVLLVLAIIFLITAPVLARRIDLQLNGSPEGSLTTPPQWLEVQLDGSVRWDGVVLPPAAIGAQMRIAGRANAPLRISARAAWFTRTSPRCWRKRATRASPRSTSRSTRAERRTRRPAFHRAAAIAAR
jgi:biopolymer transport protein ExbD